MPKISIIVQARTGSSRMPGKILKPILDKSILELQIERMKRSKFNNITIATTTEEADDAIVEIAERLGCNCYRGDQYDLLDRHYQVAKLDLADVVVKIPSDCPLIDPKIIDRVVQFYLDNDFDYVSNLHPPTYPDGNDVEVMGFGVLEYAWKNADKDYEREHTTPYIWENYNLFRIGNMTWDGGKNLSMTHRFTIDYYADYLFIKEVFEALYPKNPTFGLFDILHLLDNNPQIQEINAEYAGVNWYRNHLQDLKTINSQMTKNI